MQKKIKRNFFKLRIAYNRKDIVKVGEKNREIIKLANTLYRSNTSVYIEGKIDPLYYSRKLLKYGIKCCAIPIIKNKSVIAYKFKAI